MTSHELGNRLLDLPNLPVTRMEKVNGADQWREVTSVQEQDGEKEDDEGRRMNRPHIHIS